MAPETDDDPSSLTPDEAFSVLANETRMEILRTLGEADHPLSFSELRDRIGMRDSGQFNYHLDKLEGHFVRKTDEGYTNRRAGSSVIEAVLSGAITERPVLESTRTDQPCPHCGGATEVRYRENRLLYTCTECPIDAHMPLPPAGIRDRSPAGVLHAAAIWGMSAAQAMVRGVCPRCSAPIDFSVRMCEHHELTNRRCDRCQSRYASQLHVRCTNCPFGQEASMILRLLTIPAVRVFLLERGLDPVTVDRFAPSIEEEILAVEPFEARFTFTHGEEALSLTVDADLSVLDVSRDGGSESAT